MRTLLLLRGAPGCGKSTWIREHGLEDYALSADKIRMMCAGPKLTADGGLCIDQGNDKAVWDFLFKILELRMKNGEFTVIDATNSKTSDINRYKKYCEDYRYRMFCVDMTGLPIEICKERNLRRDPLQQVPEDVIDKMYARFATQKIPSGVTVIKPDELDRVWFKPIDLSRYKAVHHIGDIHGCYTALGEYFERHGGIKDDEFYIFLGDYLDRGIETAETMRFLLGISGLPNVLLLEGNHERHIWRYANGGVTPSREFEVHTRQDLDDAGLDKKELRRFYRRLGQCAWYSYHDEQVIVTHGGLSELPPNLTLVASQQMIKGVGFYNQHTACMQSFERLTDESQIQIYAHRNTKDSPIHELPRCYNLEGHVEFGGDLRAVKLTPDGIEETAVKNTVFRKENLISYQPETPEDSRQIAVGDLLIKLRENKYIQEKRFGDISSFNFTRAAFNKDVWNDMTVKARGLYINVPEQRIAARGYAKFFNINERPDTTLEALQRKLSFPAVAYRKENGFLGMVAYDPSTDDLFITTKSNPEGEYAQWFRAMLEQRLAVNQEAREYFKYFLRENNVTALFECVDIEHDPHVIDYSQSKLFLLDLVKNDIQFEKLEYQKVHRLAGFLHVEPKEYCYTFADWQEFHDWVIAVTEEDYPDKIEGYVVEGANGYMVKVKLPYYRFWKHMRGLAHSVIRTGELRPQQASALTTPIANYFIAWVKTLHGRPDVDDIPKDICSLRRMFFATEEGKSFAVT